MIFDSPYFQDLIKKTQAGMDTKHASDKGQRHTCPVLIRNCKRVSVILKGAWTCQSLHKIMQELEGRFFTFEKLNGSIPEMVDKLIAGIKVITWMLRTQSNRALCN
jgi:hypothetical protein